VAHSVITIELLSVSLLSLVLNYRLLSGTPVKRWFNTFKEIVEKSDFQYVARALISFLVRLVAFFRTLRIEFGGRQNNVYPSNSLENNINSHSAAVEALNEEDRVGPCIQRLDKLEKVFGELSSKPAVIPLEKERMIMESLHRIKSVEVDLEQTKKVRFVLHGLVM
jgi:hypothetical protein